MFFNNIGKCFYEFNSKFVVLLIFYLIQINLVFIYTYYLANLVLFYLFLYAISHLKGYTHYFHCYPYCMLVHSHVFYDLNLITLVFILQDYDHRLNL
jgi:hypothetical protein